MSEIEVIASMGGVILILAVAVVILVRVIVQTPKNTKGSNGNSIVRFKDCMNIRKDCNDKFEKLANFDGETNSNIKNIFHQLDNINKKLDEIKKQ